MDVKTQEIFVNTDELAFETKMKVSTSKNLSMDRKLVENELLREKLYKRIIERTSAWLQQRNITVKGRSAKLEYPLIRYLFNKKSTCPKTELEPIFLRHKCEVARSELECNFTFDSTECASEFSDFLDHELITCYEEFRSEEIDEDQDVTLNSANGLLEYKGRTQKDFADLAKNYGTQYYNAAFALGLRYSYLKLEGYGYSRDYETDTGRKSNDENVSECFCSAFNHFFNRYYSAFPDLEHWFGSRGSFFYIKWNEEPDNMTYYVCPPFDATLMLSCVKYIMNALDNNLVRNATFIFSIPGSWVDFDAIETLKKSQWLKKATHYTRGTMQFIDHMAQSEETRINYPTDICELILSNSTGT